ncbi:hypothetical protein PTKIN_Ptkin15bG0128000 [Pterospermum kingtungense]
MAPRKMKQVALKAHMKGNTVQLKRVKAEMGKLKSVQQHIKEKQMQLKGRFEEIEMQCNQLKEEAEMAVKQTARTQIKLLLMFKILKAREAGDFIEAATLTHLLRELVAKERANASLDDEEKDELP